MERIDLARFMVTSSAVLMSMLLGQAAVAQIPSESFRATGYVPSKTILLCSDVPELHIKQIQQFSDAAFGVGTYEIIDARHVDQVDSLSLTAVYFGHVESSKAGDECLSMVPALEAYFLEQTSGGQKSLC